MLMARSTPAQKPRGLASNICMFLLQLRVDFQHFDIEIDVLSRQRMIEIDSDRILCHFTHYARHFIAVTTAEQHDGADIRHPCFLEITTREELHQIRAFGTESRFRRQRESMLVPNAQSGQLIFQRVRQAAVAEAKQRRFSIAAGRFCRRAIFKLQRKMYQHGAVADKAVGQIKDRVVPVVHVEIDKVDHKAVHHTVKHVAERATNNHRKCDVIQTLLCTAAVHQHQQHHHDNQRNRREEPALPATFIRQEAERRARIVSVGQIKERNQRHGLTELKMPHDQKLTAEIDDNDENRQPKPAESGRTERFSHYANLRSSPSPAMLVTQRPQMSLCSAFWPISVVKCQQRGHFSPSAFARPIFSPFNNSLACAESSASDSAATFAPEVRSTKRSSLPRERRSVASASSAYKVTAASREPPRRLSARACSITLFTSPRTFSSSSQNASFMDSLPIRPNRPSYHSSVKTNFSR